MLAAWRPLCEGGFTDLALLRAWLDAELAVLSGDHASDDATQAAQAALDHALDPASGVLLGGYLAELATRGPSLRVLMRLVSRPLDPQPASHDPVVKLT